MPIKKPIAEEKLKKLKTLKGYGAVILMVLGLTLIFLSLGFLSLARGYGIIWWAFCIIFGSATLVWGYRFGMRLDREYELRKKYGG